MNVFYLFVFLFIAGMAWHVVTSIRIVNFLQAKGEKVNWLLIRLLLPSYAGKYQKMTRAEGGRSGPLFWQYVVSINAALLFALLAILMKMGVLK